MGTRERSGIARGQRHDRAGIRQPVAQHPRETGAEERQRQAGDDLLGAQVDRDDGVDDAQDPAGEHRHDQPDPRVAGRGRDGEARHRPHEHHPLDPEVQDARALREDLADGREQQDRAARDAGREDEGEVDHVAAVARRVTTTRYRTKASAMIRQKRIPWIIAGTPDGWISRPARINAPNRIEATTTRHGPRCARYAMMIAVNP